MSFDEEINEEGEDEEFNVEANRFEDETLVDDPYTKQDTSRMFIPFLIAFACFFPVLFCLCKL